MVQLLLERVLGSPADRELEQVIRRRLFSQRIEPQVFVVVDDKPTRRSGGKRPLTDELLLWATVLPYRHL